MLLTGGLLLVACSSTAGTGTGTGPDSGGGRLTVAAAFFPIEEIVRNVAGDATDVVSIVPPGEEAHEYEPTPRQVAALEQADVVFYLGRGFQPSVERTIAGLPARVTRVDLLDGLALLPLDGGVDPPVWLDPANMAAMTDTVTATLAARLAGTASEPVVRAAGAAYRAEVADLDTRFDGGLAMCDSRVIVTGHRAFAYLAAAYGLTQITIAGVSPAEEPSAQTLAAIAEQARAAGVRTIFFEDNLPADLSRTIADEIGVGTAMLDTAESLSTEQRAAGATYVSVMDTNLATLRTALGCT